MKLLLLIFCFNICSAQYKWTDYDTHVHASGMITGYATSSMYYVTKKAGLSTFIGVLTGVTFGLLKEYVYDKSMNRGTFSGVDIEADIKGSLTYGFFSFASINTAENHKLDTLKYQFNDKAVNVR
jgi:hypothetical protein